MRNLGYGCALLGIAVSSCAVTAAVVAITTPAKAEPAAARLRAPAAAAAKELVSSHTRAAAKPKATAARTTAHRALHTRAAAKRVAAKPAVHTAARKTSPGVAGARYIGASPSLYERTTSIAILRGQGCYAGRHETSGLVVLDFGALSYHVSKGGYGTITFSDQFAPNRAITWALKSYARGYSECLPHGSKATITLARGTSNYGGYVPSTYTAGRLWAGATIALAEYLRRHEFGHVTAAAADDVEPAWDPGFARTYDFFRGYGSSDHGYLLYNYGSLDGGVGAIWKLRQAYYVAGGMRYARAVPEIYNHEMARQWAELASLSVARYGKPIQLAGLMTQHWTSCSGCGYTAPRARHELVHELAKATHTQPSRALSSIKSITNIGVAPSIG